MGKIERIQVSPEDRERLVKLVSDRKTPQKIVWRSQIALLAGEGVGAVEVAKRAGKSVLTVRRYAAKGVDGLLKDATRPPGRKPLTARKIKQVVTLTLNEKPPEASHWSEPTMAARAGIAPSSGAQDLGGPRAEAASDENLQALARSELCRQGRGCRRPLPQPARQGPGSGGR